MTRIILIIALALFSFALAQAQTLEQGPGSGQEQDPGSGQEQDPGSGQEQDQTQGRVAVPLTTRGAALAPRQQPADDPFAEGEGGFGAAPLALLPVPDADGIMRIAVMRGLDKITARVRDVEVPVGVPVMFESFEILVQTCRRRPPEETPETTAFIQITEHRLDGTLERVFSGWMFASTPALNPVEHPVYDVWLIDCRTL